MNAMTGFYCQICGKFHEGLPMAYGAQEPSEALPPIGERVGRVVLDEDVCIIDNETFLVRGCLEIPVDGDGEPFEWGVWVSLREKNFDRTLELWDTEGRENEPSYFGWLITAIPGY